MRITKEVPSTVTEVVDVICNCCGQSCKTRDGILATGVKALGCSDSPYLTDMHTYGFDLCEACFVAIARQFKHPPVVCCVGPWGESEAEAEFTWEETLEKPPRTP